MKRLLISLLILGGFLLHGAVPEAENGTWLFKEDGSVLLSWTTKTTAPLMQLTLRTRNGKRIVLPERETRPQCVRVHEALIPAAIADGAEVTLSLLGQGKRPLSPKIRLDRPKHPAPAPLKIELSVTDPAAPRRAWQVVSGVPLAQGKLYDARQMMLTDEAGKPVAASIAPFTFWPDGSIQWLTLIFNADTERGKVTRFALVSGRAPQMVQRNAPENFRKLRCKITFADNTVDEAAISALKLRKRRLLPGGCEYDFAGDFTGKHGFALEVLVRTSANGVTNFDWAITSLKARETSLIRKIEWTGFPKFSGKDFALRQFHDAQPRQNGFASGGNFAFYSRDFWQQYPKGITATNGNFTFEVLPELPPNYLPVKESVLDIYGRYFWYRDGCYCFPAHMQIQGEFSVVTGKAAADSELFAKLDNPLFAAAPPEYCCGTGVFGKVFPASAKHFPEADRIYAESFANHLKTRDLNSEYGWMSFGDWFGENICNWGNNEYDLAYTALVNYARTGNGAYFKRAIEMARHSTSVDLHQTADPGVQRELLHLHIVGHVGNGLRPDDPRISKGKRPNEIFFQGLYDDNGGHDVMAGNLLGACFTGNKRMFDAANRALLQQARYMSAKLDVYIERTIGWHLVNLANGYFYTGNPIYLNASRLLVDEVVRRQNPRTGCLDLPIAHGECRCPDAKDHRGGKAFAMGVLLHGLRYYYDVTGDERAEKAIILGGKWLLDEAFDYSNGKFRYKTGCPEYAKGFEFWPITAEGIAYAGKFSGDPRYADFLRRYLPQEVRVRRPGTLGKDFAMATRIFPTTLALLETMGVTSFPEEPSHAVRRFVPKPGALLIPAADFSQQSGGEVRVRYDKESPLEKSLSHWDKKGHALTWEITLSQAGIYRIGIVYCGIKPASREVKINGKTVAVCAFPVSGGLGERSETWKSIQLSVNGKAVEVKLDAGTQTLTLNNGDGSSLNLGLLQLEPVRGN